MSEARTCYTRPSRLPDADEPGAGFRVLCSYSHLVFDSCQQRQRHLILIRRQDVGILADSEGIRRSAGKRNRHVQKRSGAPGLDRTADTRFRKHEEGVVARIASYAKVLHGPRFCAGSVTSRAQACWSVARRLVGRTSAAASSTSSRAAERSQPTAWSTASAARPSTSISTSVRSPTRQSLPRRSLPDSRSTRRSGCTRCRDTCDRSLCTAEIHTDFGATSRKGLTRYTAGISAGNVFESPLVVMTAPTAHMPPLAAVLPPCCITAHAVGLESLGLHEERKQAGADLKQPQRLKAELSSAHQAVGFPGS